jgi:hypothetical protein
MNVAVQLKQPLSQQLRPEVVNKLFFNATFVDRPILFLLSGLN